MKAGSTVRRHGFSCTITLPSKHTQHRLLQTAHFKLYHVFHTTVSQTETESSRKWSEVKWHVSGLSRQSQDSDNHTLTLKPTGFLFVHSWFYKLFLCVRCLDIWKTCVFMNHFTSFAAPTRNPFCYCRCRCHDDVPQTQMATSMQHEASDVRA